MTNAHRADKPEEPDSAHHIFWALINKIKAKVKAGERVFFDPTTGIQKTYLDGKLIFIRIFSKRDTK